MPNCSSSWAAAVGKRRGLAPETARLLATYLEQDRKAKIDWSDPNQRAAQLKVLFQDAEAVLDLAAEHTDDADVRATAWLLVKILGDDIAQDEHGNPQIAQGTAPDRIISITDPEMRHGHKSQVQRFNGFKVSVTTEQTNELIVDIQDARHRQRQPSPTADDRAGRAATGLTVEQLRRRPMAQAPIGPPVRPTSRPAGPGRSGRPARRQVGFPD